MLLGNLGDNSETKFMNDNGCGVLLIATSPRHMSEVALCVQSIRSKSDIPITLCTPFESDLPVQLLSVHEYTQNFMDKVRCLALSPYEKTLFLDTDTLILRADAFEIFDVLDCFDLAIAHAPLLDSGLVEVKNVPACFPELNTGVIGYRQSKAFQKVCASWQALFEQQLLEHKRHHTTPFIHDQPALRMVLYKSPIRLAILPYAFNYRCSKDLRLARLHDVRILHSRKLQRHVLRQDGTVDLDAIKRWQIDNSMF